MEDRVIAYPTVARFAAGALQAIARTSPLVMLALLMFTETRLANQLRLARTFFAFCLAPAIAVRLIEWACAAEATIDDGLLTLRLANRRIEIPLEKIARIAWWKAPLPAPGFSLELQSGRRFPYGLRLSHASMLIHTLQSARVADQPHSAIERGAAAYARAKNSASKRWDHPLVRYPLYGLVPTLPLFRLHQWIAYGGTFGEYYAYGLKAYLLAFAIFWSTSTIYLVLYGALLRAIAEAIAVAAAYFAPERAASVRRNVELVDRILFYGGVPLFLFRLYLQSVS